MSTFRQSRPIDEQVAMSARTIDAYFAKRPPGERFEIDDGGELVPWRVIEF